MRRNTKRKSRFKSSESFRKTIVFLSILIILFLLWYVLIHLEPTEEKVINLENNNQQDWTDMTEEKNPERAFNGLKIVHIDLKGAPPKISYLKKIFPLLANLGTNGILLEYEDMFPYSSNLTGVANLKSYSSTDVVKLNKFARLYNLKIIPLIQTIGHLEFILKLKEFKTLRSIPEYPHVICPNNKKSFDILFEMIDQIVQFHPGMEMIHIGGNEIHYLSNCEFQNLPQVQISKNDLFLNHMVRVSNYIKIKYPKLRILMYDDQLRDIPEEELKKSEINKLVELVVWKYSKDVYTDLGPSLWRTYRDLFPKIWFGTAFKGATKTNSYLPDVTHYLENHRSWLYVISDLKDKIKFEGVVLSGRQRFDHFSILCELFPVSVPSLALCLRLLDGYDDSPLNAPTEVAKKLNCSQPYGLLGPAFDSPMCKYPGGTILEIILKFHQVKQEYEGITENDKFKGWMNDYNLKYSFSNPRITETIINHLDRLHGELIEIENELSKTMKEIYDDYIVEEWRVTYILPLMNEINKILKEKGKLLNVDDWPRKPLIN